MPPPSFEPAACAGHGFSTSASLLMRGEPRLRCRKANLVRRLSSIKPLELPVPLLTAERLMDGPELQFRNVRFTPNSGHFPRGPICPLSAKSGHGLRSHLNGWRVGRSHPNAATSIEAHHPDLLSKLGAVSGEQATAGKAATTASDRQHEDRQVSILDGLARGKSEASPSSHRAL